MLVCVGIEDRNPGSPAVVKVMIFCSFLSVALLAQDLHRRGLGIAALRRVVVYVKIVSISAMGTARFLYV